MSAAYPYDRLTRLEVANFLLPENEISTMPGADCIRQGKHFFGISEYRAIGSNAPTERPGHATLTTGRGASATLPA